MGKLLYYLLIKPLSLLPLGALHLLSDILYLLIFHVIKYRKKVVIENIRNSFPEKSEQEVLTIAKQFYRHFMDLIVEAIKVFSITEEEVIRRFRLTNPEVVDQYYDQGRSIIFVAGHYNNWEHAAIACNAQLKHQTAGIYAPLKNQFFNNLIRQSREQFGLELIPKQVVRKTFNENKDRLMAVMFGADQSPSSSKKAYWTTFLNQDTAVMFGTEKYAKDYDQPVIFGAVRKIKRGYYEATFTVLEDEPTQSPHGHISELHTRAIENMILENPQYWLWTHRRWKRKREEALS